MTEAGAGPPGVGKLVFLNRYFDPDQSATSQMLTDLARGLAARGFNVHVISSRQLYTDPSARLPRRETRAGVTAHRVATTRFGRTRLIGRALDYGSFYISAALRLAILLRPRDVVIAKTDPPLISLVAGVVARTRHAALVNWQQDVFPEVASALGSNPLPRFLDALLRRARDASLRAARMNVLIGPRMLEHFCGRRIPASRLCVIENWADAQAIRPQPTRSSFLRMRLGLKERFIVCYSGNLGRAHEFETFLAAAEICSDDPSIVFLMVGGGARMDALREAVTQRALGNFRFLPYQPRAMLGDSLAAADVHLASLLPALEGLIVPSKLYGVLAAARPLIFVGDCDGDVARVIAAAGCGVAVPVGAGEKLAAAIRQLRAEPDTCASMGARARTLLESRYTLESAIDRWIAMLAAVPGGPQCTAAPVPRATLTCHLDETHS
jgi:colanic acid biosynthesis glycosyl transferase WcaI